MDVEEKIAFVTGGASGIGLAISKELVRNGARKIILVDINETTAGKAVQSLNDEFGNKADFIKADVGDTAQLEDALLKTQLQYGTIDMVFNNAGFLDETDWERMINVNFKAAVAGTYLAYKHLGKHNGGKGSLVVNIASDAGLFPARGIPIYTGCKFGVVGVTRAFGQSFHYERSGVKFVVICPGPTHSNINENAKVLDEATGEIHWKDLYSVPWQTAEQLAKHVINVIRVAENGTIWQIKENKVHQMIDSVEKIELSV